MEALCQLSYSPEEPTIYQRPPRTGLDGTGFGAPPASRRFGSLT